MATVSLSLVSHTNVGKTTLARTLLGRDVGEVRDEAHVTETAEAQLLIESSQGDQLMLWDTPGFGDSLRLARRLAQAGNPVGWFLTEVWDRWRDRAFWASQRAFKHVWEQCDVVLYMVDASQAPEDVGYLDAELQVLALAGKPTLVLLNQLGAPGQAEETTLESRWRERLAGAQAVRAVLTLDAFSRCWVQENLLWQAVAPLLPPAQQPFFERLQQAWCERHLAIWRESMDEIARRIERAANDAQAVEKSDWRGSIQRIGQLVGQRMGQALGRQEGDAVANSPEQRAMAALAERLDADVRRSTERLIQLHGLNGQAGHEVLHRLAQHYASRKPLDEGHAALWGGMITGALAGLKADVATGGLTLGGGLLAGGVLGALAAAGAAKGVNVVRGVSQAEVRWNAEVLDTLLASALLGYLAIAHHGRGRGAWVKEAPPASWVEAVQTVLEAHRGSQQPLQLQVLQMGRQLLCRLYPGSQPLFDAYARQVP